MAFARPLYSPCCFCSYARPLLRRPLKARAYSSAAQEPDLTETKFWKTLKKWERRIFTYLVVDATARITYNLYVQRRKHSKSAVPAGDESLLFRIAEAWLHPIDTFLLKPRKQASRATEDRADSTEDSIRASRETSRRKALIELPEILKSPFKKNEKDAQQKTTQQKPEDARKAIEESEKWFRGQMDLFNQGRSEEMDPTFFIPMWFAHELPQKYFKGEDPEWQSFVQCSRDHEKMKQLRNDLASMVGTAMMQYGMIKRLGDNVVVSKYWLDIDYPDGPPPAYARFGLDINEKHPLGFRFCHRPVNPTTNFRFERYLKPQQTAVALWSGVSTFFKPAETKIIADGTDFWGYSAASKRPKWATRVARPGTKRIEDSGEPNADGNQPEGMALHARKYLKPLFETVRATHFLGEKPHEYLPERGCFSISGLVEMSGTHAVITLDVLGWYNPKKDLWDTLSITVRRIQDRTQTPKGNSNVPQKPNK